MIRTSSETDVRRLLPTTLVAAGTLIALIALMATASAEVLMATVPVWEEGYT